MEVGEKQEVKLKESEREDQGDLVNHGRLEMSSQGYSELSKGLQKKVGVAEWQALEGSEI